MTQCSHIVVGMPLFMCCVGGDLESSLVGIPAREGLRKLPRLDGIVSVLCLHWNFLGDRSFCSEVITAPLCYE